MGWLGCLRSFEPDILLQVLKNMSFGGSREAGQTNSWSEHQMLGRRFLGHKKSPQTVLLAKSTNIFACSSETICRLSLGSLKSI